MNEKTPIENQESLRMEFRPYQKAICFLILDLLLIAIGAPVMDHGVLFVLYLFAIESPRWADKVDDMSTIARCTVTSSDSIL